MKRFLMIICLLCGLCVCYIHSQTQLNSSIDINLAKSDGDVTHAGSGFLYGFSAIAPAEQYFEAITPKLLRYCAAIDGPHAGYIWDWNFATQGNTGLFSEPMMERLERLNVRQQIVLGSPILEKINYNFSTIDQNGWIGDATPIGQEQDKLLFQYIERQVNYVKSKGYKNIEWDLWNEPDYVGFWPSNRTIEQFYEVWKMMFNKVRELDPNAVIVGPSYFHFGTNGESLKKFLRYAKANNCLPNRLTWHELGDDAHKQISINVAKIRAFMRNELDITPLPIDLNEIIGHTYSYSPGAHVWYFAEIEKSEVEGACHAVWNEVNGDWTTSGQNAGYMCHLLTQADPKHQPRAVFHAYAAYAAMVGQRLSMSTSNNVNGLSSYESQNGEIRILLGNQSASISEEKICIRNVSSASQPSVEIRRIKANGKSHVSSIPKETISFIFEDHAIYVPLSFDSQEAIEICIKGVFPQEGILVEEAPVLEKAQFLGGNYAVELTFDKPMSNRFDFSNFEVKAFTNNEYTRFQVVYAYVHPSNNKAIILSLQRRAVDWVSWAIAKMALQPQINYIGTSLCGKNGELVKPIIEYPIKQLDIYGTTPGEHYGQDRSDLYVAGVPVFTGFEHTLWANVYVDEQITRTVHVNQAHPQADDQGDGTEDVPFKTIKAAMLNLNPGTKVLVHPGIYRESMMINVSGMPDAPIIIEGIESDSVIISGADDWSSNWKMNNGGISTHSFPRSIPVGSFGDLVSGLGNNRENIFVDGVKYEQKASLENIVECSYYVGTDRKIHVKFPINFNPMEHLIEFSNKSTVLQANNVSYLVLRNLHFTKSNERNDLNGSNFLIEGCSFTQNNFHGLTMKGNCFVVRETSFNDNGASGLDFTHSGLLNGDWNSVNYNIVIESCNFQRNNWRLGGYGGLYGEIVGGLKACSTLNGVFRGLSFSSNLAPALWLDIHHSNITIEDCYFQKERQGLWLEICHGDILVRNNVIENCNSGIHISHSGGAHMDGNLLIGNSDFQLGYGWQGGAGDTRDCCFKTIFTRATNNIVVGKSQLNTFSSPLYNSFYSTCAFANNIYYSSHQNAFGNLDFSSWKKIISPSNNPNVPQERNSKWENPLLTKDERGNWNSASSSILDERDGWEFPTLEVINDFSVMPKDRKGNLNYYYTTNGFIPTIQSTKFTGGSINLKQGDHLVMRALSDNNNNKIFSLPLFYNVPLHGSGMLPLWKQENCFLISVNPVLRQITCNYGQLVTGYLKIYNTQGGLAYSCQLRSEQTSIIELTSLEKGVYIAVVESDKIFMSSKFIL